MGEPIAVFENLSEAITHVFKAEKTFLLTLPRIYSILSVPHLDIKSHRDGLIPCSTITRRRISSALSSSDLFVRAGPVRAGLWAIRPSNPLFLTDSALTGLIEQMLTAHGPLSLQQFSTLIDLAGIDCLILDRFMIQHRDAYARAEVGSYWFAGQNRPIASNFQSIGDAVLWAFMTFPEDASVEELHWLLCLSTVGQTKRITRRSISRELSRRTDRFAHVSRARYALIRTVERPGRVVFPGVPVEGEPVKLPLPSVLWSDQGPQLPGGRSTWCRRRRAQPAMKRTSLTHVRFLATFLSLHIRDSGSKRRKLPHL
jgi:hypothetical protein